ncbi:MAG: cobalamin-binding protein [bacterium]
MKPGLRNSVPYVAGASVLVILLFLSVMLRHTEGESAEYAGSPERIVSLAPSVTEILFSLGLDDRIAGVTDFCDYPAEARQKPTIGGFKGKSLEAIVGLNPDLVIGTRDGNQRNIIQKLNRLGIRVFTTEPATLTGVIESVRKIGKVTDQQEQAEELARRLERRLVRVSSRVQDADRAKVLFVYDREHMILAGPGTFADDMIRWAGGENLAADARMPYPRFSMETVLSRRPEVIVEGVMGSQAGEGSGAREFWTRWESLPAVKNDRILLMDQDLLARPGPRIFDGLYKLARALHPERFADKEQNL